MSEIEFYQPPADLPSSQEVFEEALATIPFDPEFYEVTSEAATGVIDAMALFDPEGAQAALATLENAMVVNIRPERSKVRIMDNILRVRVRQGWEEGIPTTVANLFDAIEGVPFDKQWHYKVKAVERVAQHSGHAARALLTERLPEYVESGLQLNIAKVEAKKDPQTADGIASAYLRAYWSDEKPLVERGENESEENYQGRLQSANEEHLRSLQHAACDFAELLARHGDLDIAENLLKYLPEEYDALDLKEVIARRKRKQLAAQASAPAVTADEKIGTDTVGEDTLASPGHGIVLGGEISDALAFIGGVLQVQTEQLISMPGYGPKADLERVLIDLAKTDPARAQLLVENGFPKTGEQKDQYDELIINVLIAGAEAHRAAGHMDDARKALAQAYEAARQPMAFEEEYAGAFTEASAADPEYRALKLRQNNAVHDKFKAWRLAQIAKAIAQFEQQ